MRDATITPLRPPAPSGYTDTAALNDIHALLTTGDPGDDALTDIALILARTGRPMVPAPRHRDHHHRDSVRLAGGLRSGR